MESFFSAVSSKSAVEKNIPCKSVKNLDCIYCIYEMDKLDEVKTKFENYGLQDITYVKHTCIDNINLYNFEAFSSWLNDTKSIKQLVSKIPKDISYLLCLYHALQQNFQYILILKDNIVFMEPVETFIQVCQEAIDLQFGDLIHLGYCSFMNDTIVEPINNRFTKIAENCAISCTIATIHKMSYLKYFFQSKIKDMDPTDNDLQKFCKSNSIQRLISNYPYVYEYNSK